MIFGEEMLSDQQLHTPVHAFIPDMSTHLLIICSVQQAQMYFKTQQGVGSTLKPVATSAGSWPNNPVARKYRVPASVQSVQQGKSYYDEANELSMH